MCLTCAKTHPLVDKPFLEELFYPKLNDTFRKLKHAGIGESGNYLHTHDNKLINLNYNQINEIIDHALGVIVTGIDLRLDVWAIQWPNDYQPKTFH